MNSAYVILTLCAEVFDKTAIQGDVNLISFTQLVTSGLEKVTISVMSGSHNSNA